MQSLTNATSGNTYTIAWLPGSTLHENLFEKMGLTEGSPICLIQNLNGHVMFRFGEHLYGMSSDAASRIKVC